MVKLRLKRFGKKREPSYRIIAIHSTTRRDARPLEELGTFNPRTHETKLNIEGIVTRLKQGAQPTDTVRKILQKANIFDLLKVDTDLTATVSAWLHCFSEVFNGAFVGSTRGSQGALRN